LSKSSGRLIKEQDDDYDDEEVGGKLELKQPTRNYPTLEGNNQLTKMTLLR